MVTSEWPSVAEPSQGTFIARQARYLRSAGVEVEVFAFRGARRAANYARAVLALRQRFRRAPFDLVHAQFGHSGALALLATDGPLVVTFRGSDVFGVAQHGGGYKRVTSGVLRGLSGVAARRADAAVVVSRRMLQHLPRRAYTVLPSGIDLELFAPMPQRLARQRLGLPLQGRLVLFAGNARKPVKRFPLACEVMARLRQTCPAELVVVEKEPVQAMPLYMNACDALLLTSSHEGSPNVVKEALACNMPVVSVDVGDVCERLAPVSGCVVSADERPSALAAALATVLNRGGRVQGRGHVLDLDEHTLTGKLVALYETVLRS